MRFFIRGTRLLRVVGLVAPLLLMLAGCGQAPAAFGSTPEAGRANAEELVGAFATRFTQATRIGTLDHTHDQLVRHALFPSRLYKDSTLWNPNSRGATKTLSVYGTLVGSQYHLSAQSATHAPARAGDISIVTNLTRIGESEYRWQATSDLALGTLTADDFFRGLRASLAELEGRSERGIRTEYATTLPRTRTALGALFDLDTIRSVRRDDGSAMHTAAIRLHPDRARTKYPTFGKYLDDYLSPARWRLSFTDHSGVKWLEMAAARDVMTIRARTKEGRLLPLEGAPRPLPDSLQLRADVFLHILFFDVGMTELAGDVKIIRESDESGFAVRFRREPRWHFPLATDRLIKTPLRRPFSGEGALFRLTVRDSAGAQTVISRQVGMDVQESAILRWLARLNRTAADDFTANVDVESNRFLVDVFSALRADIRAPRSGQARSDGEY